MSIFVQLFFAITLIALLGFGIYGVYAEFRRVHRVQTWTYTTAHVLSSHVTASSGYEDMLSFNVQVEYQYEVDGSPYRRTASLMAASGPSRKHAEALCQSHPPGAELPIVYDPKQVDESEIADPTGFRSDSIVILIIVILLAFFFLRFFAR